jgi:hypothetical protein
MVIEILSYLAVLLFGMCAGMWTCIAIEEKQKRDEQKKKERIEEAQQIANAILNQLNKGE